MAHAGLMFCSIFVGSMAIGLAGGVCASFFFGQLALHRLGLGLGLGLR